MWISLRMSHCVLIVHFSHRCAHVSCVSLHFVQILAHAINAPLFCSTLRAKLCHLVSLQLHECEGLAEMGLDTDILSEDVVNNLAPSIQV